MKENLPSNQMKLERADPKNNPALLSELAGVYADVFAGPPWNEYTKCVSGCNEFFGLDTKPGDPCPNKDGILSLAYPSEDTVEYIVKEMGEPNAVIFLGKVDGKIIGFTWGYCYTPERFSKEKYRTPLMREKIVDLFQKEGIGEFFYLSESGLINSYRGLGLANEFYRKRLEFAKRLCVPIVGRTNCNSPMVAISETFGLKQIMGPEMTVDRKSRLISPTGALINDFRDSEIEERVLFVLK